jgi:hypothetical protein
MTSDVESPRAELMPLTKIANELRGTKEGLIIAAI